MTKHSINSQLPIGCDTPSFFPHCPQRHLSIQERKRQSKSSKYIAKRNQPNKRIQCMRAREREST